jgi:hypothetical protein
LSPIVTWGLPVPGSGVVAVPVVAPELLVAALVEPPLAWPEVGLLEPVAPQATHASVASR